MIKRHWANIRTFFEHRITNAAAESINEKIQTVKRRARGFRNRERFRNAIYFHCGGLDLDPATLGAGPHDSRKTRFINGSARFGCGP